VIVGVGIDEDLEIIVVEDDRVAFGKRRPDVGLLETRAHVQALIVPQHLGARGVKGGGHLLTLDVHELLSPWRSLPGKVIQSPIDHRRRLCTVRHIPSRMSEARQIGDQIRARAHSQACQQRASKAQAYHRYPSDATEQWGGLT